ncbi:MAG: CCA tRNA nucleotidyltransferase [Rhodospirillales bacterium]|nr:CCA tRNA nucleotidyltransferase [Rhodospirillales bacterium]
MERVVTVPIAEPVGEIAPQPWMTAPQTREVLDALHAAGADARFIGGCVRDALLKRPIRDIDIATPKPPEAVMAALRTAGIKVVPTGLDHGTVTAVVDTATFEITTLRIDVETDGRRARVAFTDDWIVDAARRDFTINAMSCTPAGDVYDYFGGLEDLGHGRIRFVGDARDRINEDVLRLLRYFRFYAHYGRPPADADALAACRQLAAGLTLLSGERVRVEVFRTLMANDPADVFQLMADDRVLEHVLPEAHGIGRLRLMTWLDTRAIRFDSVAPDPVRRLAALLETDGAGALAVAARLKMSNDQTRRLAMMAEPPERPCPDTETQAVRRALHRLGADTVRDLVLLGWAGELAVRPRLPHERTQAWIGLIEAADSWTPVTFPLRGRDVLALGVAHGRRVGALLKAVEQWWEAGDYAADHDACLARLRTLVEAGY